MAEYLEKVSGLNVDELAYSILFMNANHEVHADLYDGNDHDVWFGVAKCYGSILGY